MRRHKWIAVGAVLLISGIVSAFASGMPDGLERVAEDFGFSGHEDIVWQFAPAADYQVPVTENHFLRNGFAGWIGSGLVFLIVWLWGRWLVREK